MGADGADDAVKHKIDAESQLGRDLDVGMSRAERASKRLAFSLGQGAIAVGLCATHNNRTGSTHMLAVEFPNYVCVHVLERREGRRI